MTYSEARRIHEYAKYYKKNKKNSEAEELFLKAIGELVKPQTEADWRLHVSCYEHLAEINIDFGNLKKALEYANFALGISQKIKNDNLIASSYRLIAKVYSIYGKKEKPYIIKAIKLYLEMLKIWKKLNNVEMLGYTYFDLASDSFKIRSDPEFYATNMLLSMVYLRKAIEIKDSPVLHLRLGQAYDFLALHIYRKCTGLEKFPELVLEILLSDKNIEKMHDKTTIDFIKKLLERFRNEPMKFDFFLKFKAVKEYMIYKSKTGTTLRELGNLLKFFKAYKIKAKECLKADEWEYIEKKLNE